jgi:hypothetical protein
LIRHSIVIAPAPSSLGLEYTNKIQIQINNKTSNTKPH